MVMILRNKEISMEKKCINCKHYKEFNDCQGECLKVVIGLDGSEIDSKGKAITTGNCVYEERIELSLDGCVDGSYFNEEGFELDVSEILSDIRVLVGQDFGCIYWEEK